MTVSFPRASPFKNVWVHHSQHATQPALFFSITTASTMTNTNTATSIDTQTTVSMLQQKRRRVTVSDPCNVRRPHLVKAKRRSSLPILKHVQFSETSEICVLDRHQTTTAEDWYTLPDQERFKKQRIVDLVTLRKPQKSLYPSCPVGLEQFLSSRNRQQSMHNRRLIIHVVLSEQNRQRELGLADHDRLAMLASSTTTEEIAKAMKRGKFQEMARFMD